MYSTCTTLCCIRKSLVKGLEDDALDTHGRLLQVERIAFVVSITWRFLWLLPQIRPTSKLLSLLSHGGAHHPMVFGGTGYQRICACFAR